MFENTILDLVFAPWCTNVVFAANRLRVFTLLAEKEMSASELGQRVGGTTQLLVALLDACVSMGLLRRRNGRYANSHLSDAYLVEGRPLYIGDFIEVQAAGPADGRRLAAAIAEGHQAVPRQSEGEIGYRQFTLAMHGLAVQGDAEALAAAVDLAGCRCIADVGCGSGIYSVAMCRHYPNLRATLLDRPEVLETAREIVRQHGLENRIEFRPADITTDTYGEGLDAVLLSDVLYQDKVTCLTILRSAHGALADRGKLIIRGYYSDPNGTDALFGALFVVNVQLDDASREPITLSRLRDWVREAGFSGITAFALSARSTCLTAQK